MRWTYGLAALVALGAGCDPSGIHGLGRRRDALVPCEVDPHGMVETTSTWVRSTDEGTEILLFGRPDPLAEVEPGRDACFGHGFVAHDGSTRFDFGSYTLDEDGRGQAVHEQEYEMTYQPDRSILDRDGAFRTDLPAPVDERLELSRDGTSLVVAIDGAARHMTSLGAVVEAVDVTTQAGAEDVFRLFNLPLFTSQARLLGFGSAGMTQYVGVNAEFGGTVRNRFTVTVAALLNPDTVISYFQLEDLTGIVVDGLQNTDVNTSGNGSMNGVLSFVMRGTGGATDVVIRGALDYEGLQIGDGFAAGGGYTLTIDGAPAPYAISWELAADVDLRDVLPPTPGE
jgi:hypothetical protein